MLSANSSQYKEKTLQLIRAFIHIPVLLLLYFPLTCSLSRENISSSIKIKLFQLNEYLLSPTFSREDIMRVGTGARKEHEIFVLIHPLLSISHLHKLLSSWRREKVIISITHYHRVTVWVHHLMHDDSQHSCEQRAQTENDAINMKLTRVKEQESKQNLAKAKRDDSLHRINLVSVWIIKCRRKTQDFICFLFTPWYFVAEKW